MDYKTVLQKINIEISKNDRAAARAFLLQEKKTGKAAAAVWDDIIIRFGSDIARAGSDIKPVFDEIKPGKVKSNKSTMKTGKARKKESKTVIKENNDRVEIYSGDVVGGGLSSVPDAGGLDMSEIEKKIEQCIDDFCIRYEIDGIQGIKKSRQSTWAALCKYIGVHVFKGSGILKDNNKTISGCMPSTCNKYDIKRAAAVLSYCEYLCGIYEKVFTWWSACDFIGADSQFIADHEQELTSAGFPIRKKTENSINNSILDGRTNPTGAIATLNHRFNWSNAVAASPAPAVNVTVYPVLNAPSAASALPDNGDM